MLFVLWGQTKLLPYYFFLVVKNEYGTCKARVILSSNRKPMGRGGLQSASDVVKKESD